METGSYLESLASTKRSREVSDQLHQLGNSGSVLESRPQIDFEKWKRMSPIRPEYVPNISSIAVTSDSHLKEVDTTLEFRGKLLVELMLIPDMAHTGIKVGLHPSHRDKTASASGESRFFYPSGSKGLGMRSTIQDTFRRINSEGQDVPVRNTTAKKYHNAPNDAASQFSREVEQQLARKRAVQKATYADLMGVGPPLRTSLVDRPGTAASQTSIMRQRGTKLRVIAKATEGYERTRTVARGEIARGESPPGSPMSPGSPHRGEGSSHASGDDAGSLASSKTYASTGASVATLDLIQSMKLANARYGLAMKQGAPFVPSDPYW